MAAFVRRKKQKENLTEPRIRKTNKAAREVSCSKVHQFFYLVEWQVYGLMVTTWKYFLAKGSNSTLVAILASRTSCLWFDYQHSPKNFRGKRLLMSLRLIKGAD